MKLFIDTEWRRVGPAHRLRDAFVRHSAASSLSRIDNANTLKPLATEALFDEDRTVRYFAVLGIIARRGNEKVPSYPRFAKHEAEMTSRIQDWALQAGAVTGAAERCVDREITRAVHRGGNRRANGTGPVFSA
jgi:hypothetical protein